MPRLRERVGDTELEKPQVEPLEDRIVVMPDADKPDHLVMKIIWEFNPVVQEGTPQEGTVVAVGPGKYENGVLVPLSLSPGDRVVHGQYSGTRFKVDGQPYLVMRQLDVLARLNKPREAAIEFEGTQQRSPEPWGDE